MSKKLEEEWLRGRASLGAAANWTPEEMRLVAELGYALAEQGQDETAIEIFTGLAALAPATGYFQAALGALKLRTGALDQALAHLDAALRVDVHDVAALTNRGEVNLRLGNIDAATQDLQNVLTLTNPEDPSHPTYIYSVRARALLASRT